MVISWWWLWIVFIVLFALMPIGYGWGYRGWGAPYPRFYQRRRHARYANDTSRAGFNHHAWGWGGDFIWLMVMVAIIWFFAGFWWR